MTYDTHIPEKLKNIQEWFAEIITQPLIQDNKINPIAPNGKTIIEEAPLHIKPGPRLLPYERLQIYNQQYWWRLITNLQESFPLLTRLFGYSSFNDEIAVPYLLKYPSDTWTLSFLGRRLGQWVSENYKEKDKKLVFEAVELDWSFNISFICEERLTIDFNDLFKETEKMTNKILFLQPHVHLFVWEYDLLSFRDKMLDQEPDYWIENDFPDLKKERKVFAIVFRNQKNNVLSKEITEEEYFLLKSFKKGLSIEQLCEIIEKLPAKRAKKIAENLQNWFQEWGARAWFYSS